MRWPSRWGLWTDRCGQDKAPAGPLPLVVLDIHSEGTLKVPTAQDELQSRHSVLTVRTQRSAKVLAFGARMGVQMTSVPSERMDLAEARGVFGVPVPDQKPDASVLICKVTRDFWPAVAALELLA